MAYLTRPLAALFLLCLPLGSGAAAPPAHEEAFEERLVARAEALAPLETLLVAHRGTAIAEYAAPGQRLDRPVNIKSLSKLVISALVGIAIERDVIASVEQPVIELLAERRIPGDAATRIREISVKNLLTMQAGLEPTSGAFYHRWVTSDDWIGHVLSRPFVDQPGGRMLYSTGSTHLLSAALTDSSGRNTHALAQAWLGRPLGIDIPPWMRDPQGVYFGGNNMTLSPRALLIFGELYRQGGLHGGERVLDESWIAASWTPYTRSELNGDLYGYGWFITRLAGRDVYYGFGYGGQRLYVIPGLELTVVVTSDPSPPSPGPAYMAELDALVAEVVIPAFEMHGQIESAKKAGKKPSSSSIMP